MFTAKFSPDGGAEQLVIDTINAADFYIFALLNMYQSGPIHTAMLAAVVRGATVELIFDRRQQWLADLRIRELIDVGAVCYWDKHEKSVRSQYLLTDMGITLTGSYLYCYTSELRYAENLIATDDSSIASLYYADWLVHQAHSELIT